MTATAFSFLDTATRIGIRLCRDAIWDAHRCNWLGASMEPIDANWTVATRSFGPDLYDGTSGIALFLGMLYSLTGDDLFRITAQGALHQAVSALDTYDRAARIGFFNGITGIACALLRVGHTLDAPEFVDEGLALLTSLADLDAGQAPLDVVIGSAGIIPALIDVHSGFPHDIWIDLAVQHGENLLNRAEKTEIGWSWNTIDLPTNSTQHNLTGFAHGAAGIAWALLELFQKTGDDRFRVAAEEGIRYENGWYSAEFENWPDFRQFDTPETAERTTPGSYSVAWCHGAPGIGFSRVRAFQIIGAASHRRDAEVAIKTTAAMLHSLLQTGQGNYSLCHGMAGNAALLVYAGQVLSDPELTRLANQVGQFGIEHYENRNIEWPCGVMGGGATPNLMLGLAGIGYFLLQLHDPVGVPPVLIWPTDF